MGGVTEIFPRPYEDAVLDEEEMIQLISEGTYLSVSYNSIIEPKEEGIKILIMSRKKDGKYYWVIAIG